MSPVNEPVPENTGFRRLLDNEGRPLVPAHDEATDTEPELIEKTPRGAEKRAQGRFRTAGDGRVVPNRERDPQTGRFLAVGSAAETGRFAVADVEDLLAAPAKRNPWPAVVIVIAVLVFLGFLAYLFATHAYLFGL